MRPARRPRARTGVRASRRRAPRRWSSESSDDEPVPSMSGSARIETRDACRVRARRPWPRCRPRSLASATGRPSRQPYPAGVPPAASATASTVSSSTAATTRAAPRGAGNSAAASSASASTVLQVLTSQSAGARPWSTTPIRSPTARLTSQDVPLRDGNVTRSPTWPFTARSTRTRRSAVRRRCPRGTRRRRRRRRRPAASVRAMLAATHEHACAALAHDGENDQRAGRDEGQRLEVG